MNKGGLIIKVSEREDIPIKTAATIVDTLFDSMMETLEKGGTD